MLNNIFPFYSFCRVCLPVEWAATNSAVLLQGAVLFQQNKTCSEVGQTAFHEHGTGRLAYSQQAFPHASTPINFF